MKTKKSQWLFFFLFLGMSFSGTYGQHLIQPEDLVTIRAVSNPRISPDGQWIAYEVTEPTPTGKADISPNTDIWLVATSGKNKPARLTNDPSQEYAPAWSPEGKYLAYLSNKGENEKYRIFSQKPGTHNKKPLTPPGFNIEMFQWLSADLISFVAKDTLPLKKDNDEIVAGKERSPSRLWEMNLTNGTITCLTKKEEHVIAFDYSPDRKKIVLRVSPSACEDDIRFHSRLVVLDRQSLERTILGGTDKGFSLDYSYGTPHWSPDGREIASFVTVKTAYLPVIFNVPDGQAKILADTYRGTIWLMEWDPVTGDILFSSNQGAQGVFGRMDPATGKITVIRKVNRSFSESPNWSISADGKQVAFQDASFNNPDDIWVMDRNGSSAKKLTDMNPHFHDLLFGEQKTIHWKSFDEKEIEGVLILPVHYDPGKKYPLIVQVHGGPLWAWWNGCLANWHEWAQLLASHGFAVLYPNPRGSNGYGLEFALANIGDWGGGDFQDILSGVNFLIDQGIADPQRLGIGGWSYGGFMTAWAVTQTDLFHAAVMGASVTDLKTMYSTSGRPENFRRFMGGLPYGAKEKVYASHSPVTFVSRVNTPTLVLHGAADAVVPLTQSKEFYQGLLDHKTSTEFVIYPRESHGFREQNHQIDLMQRMLDWFLHYLKK